MRNNLKRHLLASNVFSSGLLCVSVSNWLDYKTKNIKGCSCEILTEDMDEMILIKVNLLDKKMADYEHLINKNVRFEGLEVVPYTRGNYLNFSYRASDVFEVS